MSQPQLLVMAAGIGSRYGGLKQIDPVGPSGEIVIEYAIYDALKAGFGKVVFIIRKEIEDVFREKIGKTVEKQVDTEYVFQELDKLPSGLTVPADRTKPWGTGHAVLVAKDIINEPFVVINADDYYGPNAYQMIPDYLSSVPDTSKPYYCMVGYGLKNTLSEHGFVSRGVCETDGDGFLETVVERTHIEKMENKIISRIDENTTMELSGNEVVSMNVWGFTPSFFEYLENYFYWFIQTNADNPKGEFYIPYVVNDLIEKQKIRLKVLESKDGWFGVTYKEDKELAVQNIADLIEKGVYPEKLW